MRRRLVGSTLTVVGIVLALFGIPLAIGAQYALEQRAMENVRAESVRITETVDFWLDHGLLPSRARIEQIASRNRYVEVQEQPRGRLPSEVGDDLRIVRFGSRPPAN